MIYVSPEFRREVVALVTEQVNSVYDILNDQLRNLVTFTQDLESQLANFDVPMADVDFTVPALVVDDFTAEIPTPPDVSTEFDVTYPGDPVLTPITVDSVALPDYDVTPPAIAEREDPDFNSVDDVLTAPAIDTDITIPDRPVLTTISAPSQASIAIPSFPDIDLPLWEGEFPEDADPGDLDISYSYSEPVYNAELEYAIKGWISDIIANGGTGLGEEVLAALRANFRSWIDEDLEEEYQKIFQLEASRGFTIPTGALNARMRTFWARRERKIQEYDNQLLSEEAKLAQQNTQFAVQYGAQLEQISREAHNQLANRTAQIAKDTYGAAIDIFNARVARYNALLEAFKTRAAVYETRVRAAGLIIEQFKSEVESQKLVLEAKGQEVQIYTAIQQSNALLIDMWVKEHEAAKTLLEAERTKLDVFKAQIDAFVAKEGAKKTIADVFLAKLASDENKAKVYAEKMRGYGILAESVNSRNQIAIEQAKLDHEVLNKGQIDIHNAAIARADSLLKAYVTQEGFKLQLYEGEIKSYEGQARVYDSKVDAQSKAYTAEMTYGTAMVDKAIKQAEINQQALMAAFNARLETLKARIATWTQTVASCLSTINNSLQLGYSGSLSESVRWQGNPDVSETHSHTYCEKECEQ